MVDTLDAWQDIGRNSGKQMRAGAGRLGGGGGVLGGGGGPLGGGGGGPHGTNDDFWLPKVKYFEPNNVKIVCLGVWCNWPG